MPCPAPRASVRIFRWSLEYPSERNNTEPRAKSTPSARPSASEAAVRAFVRRARVPLLVALVSPGGRAELFENGLASFGLVRGQLLSSPPGRTIDASARIHGSDVKNVVWRYQAKERYSLGGLSATRTHPCGYHSRFVATLRDVDGICLNRLADLAIATRREEDKRQRKQNDAFPEPLLATRARPSTSRHPTFHRHGKRLNRRRHSVKRRE